MAPDDDILDVVGDDSFNTYWSRPISAGDETLELSMFWREHPIFVTDYATPRDVWFGRGLDCDVAIELPEKMGARLPLLRATERGWALCLSPFMEGTLTQAQDEVGLLRAFSMSPLDPEFNGIALWHLGAERARMTAELELGDVRFVIRLTPRAARHERIGPIDRRPFPFIGLSTFMHVLGLIAILAIPPGIQELVDDEIRHEPTDRFARAIVVPAATPAEPILDPERQDLQGDADDEELGMRHRGDEGEAGAQLSVAPRGRASTRRRKRLEARAALASARSSEVVHAGAKTGILAGASGEQLFAGEAATLHGEELDDVFGKLDARAKGEARGAAGLGSAGAGSGGAGEGDAAGVSRTVGLHSSLMGGRGVAPRLRGRAEELEQLYFRSNAPEEQARGCLSEEIIQNAVRRRRNQIRACYEDQLLGDPELSGRVEVRLTVEPDGQMGAIEVTKNTTGSAAVGACLRHKLASLRFPAFERCRAVVANYPFNFHPKQLLIIPR